MVKTVCSKTLNVVAHSSFKANCCKWDYNFLLTMFIQGTSLVILIGLNSHLHATTTRCTEQEDFSNSRMTTVFATNILADLMPQWTKPKKNMAGCVLDR